jgi:hypothetical protein
VGVNYIAAGEEASQTYKAGAPLVYDGTSQEGEEWAGGTDATLLTGFAAADATGTAGEPCPYYEANDYTVFTANFMNGTDDLELAASHYDTDYSLLKQTNGEWTVDQSDTTTKMVHVIGPAPESAVGDTNARVKFRVLTGKQADVEDS